MGTLSSVLKAIYLQCKIILYFHVFFYIKKCFLQEFYLKICCVMKKIYLTMKNGPALNKANNLENLSLNLNQTVMKFS